MEELFDRRMSRTAEASCVMSVVFSVFIQSPQGLPLVAWLMKKPKMPMAQQQFAIWFLGIRYKYFRARPSACQ